MQKGYIGIVFVKVGIIEDFPVSTNMWPEVIMSCVKEEYDNVNDVIQNNIFYDRPVFKTYCIRHRKEHGIPEELVFLGNIGNIDIKRKEYFSGCNWVSLLDSLYRRIV